MKGKRSKSNIAKCSVCIQKCTGCIYRLVPKKFATILFGLWMFMKILVTVGIVVLLVKKLFIVNEIQKDVGNMKTCVGVTEQMINVDYWVNKEKDVTQELLTQDEINQLNVNVLETKETNMLDLERVQKKQIDKDGKVYECKFLICTTETDLKANPTEEMIRDDQEDLNEDLNQLSSIRLGEPMVGMKESDDGLYEYVCTSNCVGWVRKTDVGICENKENWLEIWKIPSDQMLIVTGTKIHLPYSNVTPELSNTELSMGCTVKLVKSYDIPPLVQGRAPYYNYVVYLPVRLEDGSCKLEMALIPENEDVHVGYLTFTKEQMVKQIYKWLGNIYGWGGMLHSQDCSGLIRDVYKCFGLELPRNTNGQIKMPVKHYDLSKMSGNEKEEQIKRMPMGTLLYMDGHVVMYLGDALEDLYCISAAGTIMNESRTDQMRLRCISVNSLEKTYRPDNTAWIDNLTIAVVMWE